MSTYKLIYFGVHAKAQIMRFMLEDNLIPYEEERIGLDDESWMKYKPNMLFAQVPCFIDGDLVLYQSGAITRHLARKHDLYGSNLNEAARIDMIYEAYIDRRLKFTESLKIREGIEKENERYVKDVRIDMQRFENLLKQHNDGKGFFVGSKISFADYAIFDIINRHLMFKKECLEGFSVLMEFYERMKNRENLAKYMEREDYKALKKISRAGRM